GLRVGPPSKAGGCAPLGVGTVGAACAGDRPTDRGAEMGQRIVIVGSSFAGLTAALGIRKALDAEHEVVVVSKSATFQFLPSLIWVPFGLRRPEDISFELQPLFDAKGIRFVHAPATELR